MLKYSIIQRNRAAGSKIWYLRTFDTETKKITFESLDTDKKGKAQELLDRKNAERFKTPAQIQQEKQPTIEKAVFAWLDTVSRGNPGTFREYSYKIPLLIEFCKRHSIEKPGDFGTIQAAALLSELPKENGPTTILNKKRVYSSFFNWAFVTYGIEKINPFQRVKTPKIKRNEREFWTVDQMEKIIENANGEDERLLFAFMGYAGLRFFEAAGLCWENIEGGKFSIVGKGDKSAKLPISPRLEKEIALFLKGNEKPSQGRIFEKHFLNLRENIHLKKICQKLDIPGLAHCHKFRHSFASNLLRAGASIVATSKLLRHERPDLTLRIYSHCLPDDLEKTLTLL